MKSALELLHGTIDVKSEMGQGSLFAISLPDAGDSVERYSILILDQDQAVRLSLKETFRTQGFESCFVENDVDMIRQLAELRPDLVMLDVRAPEYTGFQILEEIRAASWGLELPVILMSTLDAPADRAKGFELGASDFIVKPFDVGELVARVRLQLERRW